MSEHRTAAAIELTVMVVLLLSYIRVWQDAVRPLELATRPAS